MKCICWLTGFTLIWAGCRGWLGAVLVAACRQGRQGGARASSGTGRRQHTLEVSWQRRQLRPRGLSLWEALRLLCNHTNSILTYVSIAKVCLMLEPE